MDAGNSTSNSGEVEDDGAAKDSPYFSHEDIEHGQGGDFLVQQYLQNISKEEENNSNIATEQNPDDETEASPYFSHEDIEHGQGGDFLVQQYLQNISTEEENNSNIATEQNPDVETEASPYFSHEDIEHGHGGDFLVQQYLQNISTEEENNNDITTEPKSNAGLVQQYLQNINKKEENNNDIITVPKLDVDAEESPYFSDEDKQRGHGIEDNQVAPVVSIESKSGNRIEQNNDKVATNRLPVKHHDSGNVEESDHQVTRHPVHKNSRSATQQTRTTSISIDLPEQKKSLGVVSTDIPKSRRGAISYGEPSDQVRDLKKRLKRIFLEEHIPTAKMRPRKSKPEIIEELSNEIENKLGNTAKLRPRKAKAEIIEELSNDIENKLGNTKPRAPVAYNAPQINRDTYEANCEEERQDIILMGDDFGDGIYASPILAERLDASVSPPASDDGIALSTLPVIKELEEEEAEENDVQGLRTSPEQPGPAMVPRQVNGLVYDTGTKSLPVHSTLKPSSVHTNTPSLLERTNEQTKMMEQEENIWYFLNETLQQTVTNDSNSRNPTRIENSPQQNKGVESEGSKRPPLERNIPTFQIRSEHTKKAPIDASARMSPAPLNPSTTRNEQIIRDLLRTNSNLHNKLSYQSRLIHTLNAGMIEKDFALRNSMHMQEETSKTNTKLLDMMSDLEHTLKSVVDTHETSERAKQILNEFDVLNQKSNTENAVQFVPPLLSPDTLADEEDTSSESSKSSQADSERDVEQGTVSVDNASISSIFPEMLISQDDFVDKKIPSPRHNKSKRISNRAFQNLSISLSLSDKSLDSGDEIWV